MRRCDREKPWVEFPRDYWKWTPQPPHHLVPWSAHPDPLQQRAAHRRDVDQPDEYHCAHLCTHCDVLSHFRERVMLP